MLLSLDDARSRFQKAVEAPGEILDRLVRGVDPELDQTYWVIQSAERITASAPDWEERPAEITALFERFLREGRRGYEVRAGQWLDDPILSGTLDCVANIYNSYSGQDAPLDPVADQVPLSLQPFLAVVARWGAERGDQQRYALLDAAESSPEHLRALQGFNDAWTPEMFAEYEVWSNGARDCSNRSAHKFNFCLLLLHELGMKRPI